MGAHVRGRNANRYRAIVQIPEIPAEKLEAVISGYEDGAVACNESGNTILDADGEEMGELAVAIEKLTESELNALKAFNDSLIDGTHPDIARMTEECERVEELPSGYERSESAHNRLMDLLSDILCDLPFTEDMDDEGI